MNMLLARGPWQHRWLFLNMVGREVRNRYVGSVSGLFWALMHPLATLAIYGVVFTTIFKVKLPELGQYDFTTFVALGLWPWLMFAEGVTRGTVAVQGNASLVTKVAFPHEILVYAAVASTWAIHLTGYLFVILILSIFHSSLNLFALPSLFVLLSIMMSFTLGLALILSAVQVLFRDVEQFLGPVIMVWFYATPVLYPASLVPEWLRPALLANPVSYVVERCRALLMGDSSALMLNDLLMLLGCLLFALLARKFFLRLSPHFEDFL